MAIQALSDRPLIAPTPAGTARLHGSALLGQGQQQGRSRVLLLGASVVALCLLAFAAWHFAGWPGLAVTSGLSAFLAGTFAVAVLIDERRNRLEFESLVEMLPNSETLNVAGFKLGHGWRQIAQRLADAHAPLLRQARDRHAALQKLEISQRLSEAAQRRAESALNSSSDAVLITNSFGELLLANGEAQRLFGFDLANGRGKPAGALIREPALANLMEQSARRGAEARPQTHELSFACQGKPRWYKTTTAAISDEAGDHLGVVTRLRDITAEKATQARSAEFVSAVSHEIKTPLASVKAYAEMLADGDTNGDPDTQQKFLSIIQTQTDRMSRMLESMLDMARIESGVVRVEKKSMSLNELVEAGAKLMQPAAAEKNIRIDTELSELYVGVEVDGDMMSRVVMNLISNAIKYTDHGGHITLRSKMLDNQAMIEVQDTGRGIPAEALGKLFQKFFRVKENSSMAHGTGLGLSMVKHIVEEVHGGAVEVESEVGKGSIFRVKLPLFGVN